MDPFQQHNPERGRDDPEDFSKLSARRSVTEAAKELRELVGQELELDAIMRTTLEFLLQRVCATNAIIGLPRTSGDFSLGAYTNYNRPEDLPALEHLVGVLASVAEAGRLEFVHAVNKADRVALLGAEEHWLEGCTFVAFSSRYAGELVGFTMFFRDEDYPYTPEDIALLRKVGPILAEQLARAVRVNFRMIGLPDEGDDG